MKRIHRVFLRKMPRGEYRIRDVTGAVNRDGVPIPLECRILHAEVEDNLLLTYERKDTTTEPVPLRHFYVAIYDEAYPDTYEYVATFYWDGFPFYLLEIK